VYRPERCDEIEGILSAREQPTFVARGRGRSYGDTSINADGGVVVTTELNRMIAFDGVSGVLECEAGVGLDDIIDTFLPRGWFLPVTPGTKFVTVGGAIANDAHGKNHHNDGTFAGFVESFTLLAPTGDVYTCSRDKNADIFWATVGGIGLTGFILTARIRLLSVDTAYAKADYFRARDLVEAFDLMREHDEGYRYSVAWIDCVATGAQLGRSVLMCGNHATVNDLPPNVATPFDVRLPPRVNVPVDFPSSTLNPLSIRAFNELYYATNPTKLGKLVDYERYFYPLDFVHQWNRVYGKAGFTQYQFIVPPEAQEGLKTIVECLSAAPEVSSFLAVLKRCGEENEGLLSFPMPGYMLALDIPMRPGLVEFLRELDRIVLDHGGRLYLAKDACMTAETFSRMYGEKLDRFREIRRRIDPDGVLSSSQARRLEIVP